MALKRSFKMLSSCDDIEFLTRYVAFLSNNICCSRNNNALFFKEEKLMVLKHNFKTLFSGERK